MDDFRRNVEKIEGLDFESLFGDIPIGDLREIVGLAIIIDKRTDRRVNATSYAHMLDKASARNIALAFLLARGTDTDVVRYVRGVMV